MGVEDEASRCAMEAADEIKEGGIKVMPTATLDPPETGGVEAMRTGKGRPSRSERASDGKNAPIRREPDPETVPDMPTRETGKVRTTPRHKANPMKQTIPKLDEVWYVDSGASNHMTSHKEWFSYLEKPAQPGVVATGDDTPHPSAMSGKMGSF